MGANSSSVEREPARVGLPPITRKVPKGSKAWCAHPDENPGDWMRALLDPSIGADFTVARTRPDAPHVRFDIVRTLGSGAFGEVHVVTKEKFDSDTGKWEAVLRPDGKADRFAMKIYKGRLNENEEFLNEAAIIQHLNFGWSPCELIACLIETGAVYTGDTPTNSPGPDSNYILLELVDNAVSLEEVARAISQAGTRTLRLKVLESLVDGLRQLHLPKTMGNETRYGVAHQDISGQNVLLTNFRQSVTSVDEGVLEEWRAQFGWVDKSNKRPRTLGQETGKRPRDEDEEEEEEPVVWPGLEDISNQYQTGLLDEFSSGVKPLHIIRYLELRAKIDDGIWLEQVARFIEETGAESSSDSRFFNYAEQSRDIQLLMRDRAPDELFDAVRQRRREIQTLFEDFEGYAVNFQLRLIDFGKAVVLDPEAVNTTFSRDPRTMRIGFQSVVGPENDVFQVGVMAMLMQVGRYPLELDVPEETNSRLVRRNPDRFLFPMTEPSFPELIDLFALGETDEDGTETAQLLEMINAIRAQDQSIVNRLDDRGKKRFRQLVDIYTFFRDNQSVNNRIFDLAKEWRSRDEPFTPENAMESAEGDYYVGLNFVAENFTGEFQLFSELNLLTSGGPDETRGVMSIDPEERPTMSELANTIERTMQQVADGVV
jgi:serine/threonine protein kinase